MRVFSAATLVALAACAPPEAPTHEVTYRVLGGLSMGAIGTGALGFRHPEKFDALASMGGPLDAALLLRTKSNIPGEAVAFERAADQVLTALSHGEQASTPAEKG